MTGKKMNVKMLLKSIFAIAMVAALLLGCVACAPADTGKNDADTGNNGNNDTNINKYEGMTDVEYAQALTQDSLAGAVDALASGFGAYANLAGATTGNFGSKAELDLMLGDKAIDLIEQAVFGTADSGLDMSFLENIGLDMEIDATTDLTQLSVALGLSNTEIVKLLLLTDKETIWAGAPDLVDGFLEAGLEDLGVAVNTATPAALDGILSVIPSEEKLAEILNRYLALATKEIEEVQRTTETLELDGLKQDATKLTIKIYEQDALDAVKAILTAAKTDADIKKIVEDFGKFYNDMMAEEYTAYDMEWTDVDLYAEFTTGIEDLLAMLPTEAEDTETYIGLTLFVDEKHNVIGMSLTAPGEEESVITVYSVTDGNNFKCVAELPDDTKLTGAGTINNGKVSGNYTVSVENVPVIKFELVDFDTTDADAISGTIRLDLGLTLETIFMTSKVGPMENTNTVAPTAETQDSSDIFTALGLQDAMLELKLDITNEKSNVEMKLLSDNALIIGLALKAAAKSPAALQKPTNTVDVTDYEAFMGWVAGIDFDAVMDNLTTAGVPEMLVNALGGIIPAA